MCKRNKDQAYQGQAICPAILKFVINFEYDEFTCTQSFYCISHNELYQTLHNVESYIQGLSSISRGKNFISDNSLQKIVDLLTSASPWKIKDMP